MKRDHRIAVIVNGVGGTLCEVSLDISERKEKSRIKLAVSFLHLQELWMLIARTSNIPIAHIRLFHGVRELTSHQDLSALIDMTLVEENVNSTGAVGVAPIILTLLRRTAEQVTLYNKFHGQGGYLDPDQMLRPGMDTINAALVCGDLEVALGAVELLDSFRGVAAEAWTDRQIALEMASRATDPKHIPMQVWSDRDLAIAVVSRMPSLRVNLRAGELISAVQQVPEQIWNDREWLLTMSPIMDWNALESMPMDLWQDRQLILKLLSKIPCTGLNYIPQWVWSDSELAGAVVRKLPDSAFAAGLPLEVWANHDVAMAVAPALRPDAFQCVPAGVWSDKKVALAMIPGLFADCSHRPFHFEHVPAHIWFDEDLMVAMAPRFLDEHFKYVPADAWENRKIALALASRLGGSSFFRVPEYFFSDPVFVETVTPKLLRRQIPNILVRLPDQVWTYTALAVKVLHRLMDGWLDLEDVPKSAWTHNEFLLTMVLSLWHRKASILSCREWSESESSQSESEISQGGSSQSEQQ